MSSHNLVTFFKIIFLSVLIFSTEILFSQIDSVEIKDSTNFYKWRQHRFKPEIQFQTDQKINNYKFDNKSNFNLKDKSKLKKSGMIFRGVSLSTSSDLSLQSGFRLDLSGKASDDIYLTAALTDQNSILSNQGSTQKLREVDNVFINVKSENINSTLGDFVFENKNIFNSKISRKIQGIQLNYFSKNDDKYFSDINIAIGSTKGKYHSQEIIGVENLQGPYKLYGKNGERNIIIISGSENIYLDGKIIMRGQSNDYVIDYSNGEIIFSYKNIITKHTRITVDFEYNDLSYIRNLYNISFTNSFIKNKLILQTSYLTESDDENNFVQQSITENDKNDFKNLEGNRLVKSSVKYVGIDTTTKIGIGNYETRDTTINNNTYKFYKFNVGSVNSLYNINFNYVGVNKGYYKRNNYGNYEFASLGKGDYDTLYFINAPQKNSILNLSAKYKINDKTNINYDLQLNSFQQNSFQNKYLNRNNSNFNFDYTNDFNLYKVETINFNLKYRFRNLNKQFNEFDRVVEVEHNRNWGIDSTTTFAIQKEIEQELNVNIFKNNLFKLNLDAGVNSFSNNNSAERSKIEFDILDSLGDKISFITEQIINNDKILSLNNNWNKNSISTKYNYSKFTSVIEYFNEKRELKNINYSDSLYFGSFNFNQIKTSFNYLLNNNINFKIGYENRTDYLPTRTNFSKYFSADNYEFQSVFNTSSNFSGLISLKNRSGKYFQTNTIENAYFIRTELNKKDLNRIYEINVLQELSTEKIPLREKIFYQVRRGDGAYEWIDGNANGRVDLNDEMDFRLNRYDGNYNITTIATDKFEPISSFKSTYRLTFSKNIWSKIFLEPIPIISNLSSETILKYDMQSKSFDRKYFTNNFNINEILFANYYLQQDLHLFENNPDYNFRFRVIDKKTKNTIINGSEINLYNEYSLKTRIATSQKQKHEINILNKNQIANSIYSFKDKNITLNELNYDYSESIDLNLEYGLLIGYAFGENEFNSSTTSIEKNNQAIRLTRYFDLKSQLRLILTREENLISTLNNIPSILIYEITEGKNLGISYIFQISFDSQINEFIQMQIQYSSRKEPTNRIYHNFIGNIKALF